MKIGILVVAMLVALVILKKFTRKLTRSISGLIVLAVLAVGGGLIYKTFYADDESFADLGNTTQSPIDDNNNSNLCYRDGEQVDCNLLDSEDDQMELNMNQQNGLPEQGNNAGQVEGSYGVGNDEAFRPVESNQASGNQLPNECYPKDVLSPKELLPKDTDSVWAQSVPSGQGSLGDQNFLDAGFHIGMNTVGQTLRNANYQLRSEPANPQVKVSPWMQSTIEPDTNRKPLEIGA